MRKILLLAVLLVAGCSAMPLHPRPVLFVFHAAWCVNCPSNAQIAAWANDNPNVYIRNIDVDEQPDVADRYEVDAVPLFLLWSPCKCDGGIGNHQSQSATEVAEWLMELKR